MKKETEEKKLLKDLVNVNCADSCKLCQLFKDGYCLKTVAKILLDRKEK